MTNDVRRAMSSEYMFWAKTRSQARFNLAASGMPSVNLSELGISTDDIELSRAASYGYAPLLEAIAARFSVAPDCVVHADGTSMANHLALAALIEPGDEVLIEQPTYELIVSAALYLGATLKRFARTFERDFQIDPREIERLVTPRTRLIVLTNLHNPSSAYTNEETLKEIGDIARRVGARVLVDEVYLDAAFKNEPRTSFHLGGGFIATKSDHRRLAQMTTL